MLGRLFLLSLTAFCACATPRSESTIESPAVQIAETPPVVAAPPEQPVAPPVAPPPAPVSATRIASNASTYLVRCAPEITGLPSNQPFELELWIADASSPDELAREVTLAVDAAMPEHGHGMVRRPIVERLGDGHFVARGMLLHMSGRWELYFDVTRGAVTERAQAAVTLE